MLEIAKGAGSQTLGLGSPALIQGSLKLLLKDFKTRGYAWSIGETESHISAIALPIVVSKRALGAIKLVFFRSAMGWNSRPSVSSSRSGRVLAGSRPRWR